MPELEAVAVAGSAGKSGIAAALLDEKLGKRQPQARTTVCAGSRFVDPVETHEHFGLMSPSKARALVRDSKNRLEATSDANQS